MIFDKLVKCTLGVRRHLLPFSTPQLRWQMVDPFLCAFPLFAVDLLRAAGASLM